MIGAVLIPGAKAPRLIEREDLKLMKPGSVIIDVAIDQGGCVATSRPTTHSEPTYIVDDVRALLRDQHARRRGPHQHLRPVQRDAAVGVWQIAKPRHRASRRADSQPVARAVNIMAGEVTNQAVAETFGLPYVRDSTFETVRELSAPRCQRRSHERLSGRTFARWSGSATSTAICG